MLSKKVSAISKRVSSGLTPLRSNPEFWENGTIPWLKTEQLGEKYIFSTTEKIAEAALIKTSIKVYPPDTLSIAMYGEGKTRGNVSIIKSAMATNQACCNIEIDPELANFEYVYYFLKTQYNELRNLSSGVRKNLNSEDIKNFTIRFPYDLADQTKIASILSSLDAKIDCNNRISEKLESLAKLLYDYWFVQFDYPDENGRPYKSSGGQMVYNDKLKRDIPKDWNAKELGQISDLYQPKTISEKEMSSDGRYLVYGANGIVGRYDQYNHDESVVAITCRGNSCGEINITRPYSWITGNAMVVKPRDNIVSVDYLFNTLKRAGINKIITGSAQPQITRSNLSPLMVIAPEESLISKYSLIIASSFNKRISALEENECLESLRDWLLPMLMNGQITVS